MTLTRVQHSQYEQVGLTGPICFRRFPPLLPALGGPGVATLLANGLATFANFQYGGKHMATMNISLTPQLEKLVNDRVESGLYTSASEVIREALRLLDSRDRGMNHQLRTDVEAGLRQLEVRQSRPFDNDAVERLKKAGRVKLAALESRKP